MKLPLLSTVHRGPWPGPHIWLLALTGLLVTMAVARVLHWRWNVTEGMLEEVVLDVALAVIVIAALSVGDQSAIAREDWELFRITGLSHLMAISGVHITMLAWLAAAAIGWLWRRSSRAMLAVPAPVAARWGGLALAAALVQAMVWGLGWLAQVPLATWTVPVAPAWLVA